nr:DNA-binding protein [uncultured Rhodopila sp.]
MSLETIDRSALFLRDEAPAFLKKHGFQTTVSTLATLATRGGGPVYRKFGNRPVYTAGDLLDWAHSRLSEPCRSTSEDAARRTAKQRAATEYCAAA